MSTAAPVLVRIVHFGDSITFGQYCETDRRWTNLVTDRLTRKYLETSFHVLAMNKGISGETSRMGLERFPQDLQAHTPDIVTLQFGMNDCNCWLTDRGAPRVSAAAFRANMLEMIDRARRFGARHIIVASNPVTLRHKVMLNGERYEDANARYSGILREVADEAGTSFCDVRASFLELSVGDLEDMLLPYPDLLHLSAAGNHRYADVIWPMISAAVEETIAGQLRSIAARLPIGDA
jgi:lysophospholipase L1-like esterase